MAFAVKRMRWLASCLVLVPSLALAQVSENAERPDTQFDFMNVLTDHGLHDIKNERWNAYGQFTFIMSGHPAFHAAYTNLNGSNGSLLNTAEASWTASLTLLLGVKLWHGAEVYFVPEVIAEQPFSQLKGLGGVIQNFELQKTGGVVPQIYRSRAYLQQTIDLGGDALVVDSNPMQLGTIVKRRRIVLRAGNFSIIDFLDKNTFTSDTRKQFNNMAFLTYAAYDFAADARGYTFGGEAEVYFDDWSLRFARVAAPQDPNQLPLNFRIDESYGDQLELEHDHIVHGQAGAVRVLAYRNQENTGSFSDAIAASKANPDENAAACGTRFNYGSTNATAPDLCWARKRNVKLGIGLNLEQHLTADIGVFARAMYSDGRTEVYSFGSTDRSLSLGALGKGALWHRPADIAGVGLGFGWISQQHADYLRLGGVDGFIGDGAIHAAMESVFEIFYSVNVLSSLWLTADYQHITNPAFNADRGPVDIFSARFHAEF